MCFFICFWLKQNEKEISVKMSFTQKIKLNLDAQYSKN